VPGIDALRGDGHPAGWRYGRATRKKIILATSFTPNLNPHTLSTLSSYEFTCTTGGVLRHMCPYVAVQSGKIMSVLTSPSPRLRRQRGAGGLPAVCYRQLYSDGRGFHSSTFPKQPLYSPWKNPITRSYYPMNTPEYPLHPPFVDPVYPPKHPLSHKRCVR